MVSKLRPVRGTRDIWGDEARRAGIVVDCFRAVSERYGFQEISTPIFEFSDVFRRTLGEIIVKRHRRHGVKYAEFPEVGSVGALGIPCQGQHALCGDIAREQLRRSFEMFNRLCGFSA